MEVDDHEIGWDDCEGVIPDSQYGAGAVIVWDRGSYRALGDEPVERGLESGHLSFWLEGEKLRGGWTLQRVEGRRWLLVKRRDDEADAHLTPVSTQPESVVSGRRIDEVES
jgi:DNA ligase D-like protein (predicted 3'-phosphoesterase)